jgi:hypothetical protein
MSDAESVRVPAGEKTDVLDLVASLHDLSDEDSKTVKLLVAGLQQQVFELMATLDVVRADIIRALAGPYVAHPDVVRVLLYPEQQRVAAQAETVTGQARAERKGHKDG